MSMEQLHSGELYSPNDPEIMVQQEKCLEKIYDFNATRPSQGALREEMLKDMFAEVGEGCYIEPPLHSNWGGHHVHFGKWVYANFGLTLVDDTHIYVGDYTLIGPNVVIATAGHPSNRASGNRPISTICRSALDETVGWGRVSLWCPVLPLAIMWSSARAA